MAKRDNFDLLFRDKADRMRLNPNENAWNRLDSKLKRKKRSTGYLSSNLGIAASLLLLISFSIIFYLSNTNQGAPILANYEIKPLELHSEEANLSIVEINDIYKNLTIQSPGSDL